LIEPESIHPPIRPTIPSINLGITTKLVVVSVSVAQPPIFDVYQKIHDVNQKNEEKNLGLWYRINN
jgi:hypothetical protein